MSDDYELALAELRKLGQLRSYEDTFARVRKADLNDDDRSNLLRFLNKFPDLEFRILNRHIVDGVYGSAAFRPPTWLNELVTVFIGVGAFVFQMYTFGQFSSLGAGTSPRAERVAELSYSAYYMNGYGEEQQYLKTELYDFYVLFQDDGGGGRLAINAFDHADKAIYEFDIRDIWDAHNEGGPRQVLKVPVRVFDSYTEMLAQVSGVWIGNVYHPAQSVESDEALRTTTFDLAALLASTGPRTLTENISILKVATAEANELVDAVDDSLSETLVAGVAALKDKYGLTRAEIREDGDSFWVHTAIDLNIDEAQVFLHNLLELIYQFYSLPDDVTSERERTARFVIAAHFVDCGPDPAGIFDDGPKRSGAFRLPILFQTKRLQYTSDSAKSSRTLYRCYVGPLAGTSVADMEYEFIFYAEEIDDFFRIVTIEKPQTQRFSLEFEHVQGERLDHSALQVLGMRKNQPPLLSFHADDYREIQRRGRPF